MPPKNQSLSLQKAKRKVNKHIRNVLAIPKEESWPVVSSEVLLYLKPLLKSCLGFAKVDKPRPPWQELQSLKREERKKREDDLLNQQPLEVQIEIREAMKNREYLLLGVNSVSKGIEEGLAACCVVAEDANPQILVKHIITLANHRSIPVLVVPELKSITMEALGFSCLSLGFKNVVLEDKTNIFYKICTNIKELSGNFTVKDSVFDDMNEIETWIPSATIEKKDVIKDNVESKNWHLYRDSSDYRVFSMVKPPEIKAKNEMEFISLEIDIKDKMKSELNNLDKKNKQSEDEDDELEIIESICDHPNIDDLIIIDTSPKKNVDHLEKEQKFHPTKILRLQSNPNKFKKCKPQKFKKGSIKK